jgi:hypothetical protein
MDNIGGFKINGTVVVGHDWPLSGGSPDSSLGTPSTEIFNAAAAGLIITVALQVLKAIIVANIR